MDQTVQIREHGVITIPVEIRQRHGINPGDTYRLLDLDGILVLTPMVTLVPELAREIERARIDAGLDTETMLKALREERARYYADKYGGDEPG